ncbi:MAG TPA: nucleoside hydrolase [Actinomycetales bacterium]|nr:nucleoside hydrolase [Actinomycetales bacterium]
MSARRPVLLDCDPGIDDALAIAYLAAEHRAGRIALQGVVATAGNVGIDDTVRNALAWLDLAGAGAEVSVAAGAAGATVVPHAFTPETHGPRGAGYAALPEREEGTTARALDARSGARLWVDLARAHPGELVAVVTGPSSTLAAALDLEPALPRLLRRLVVMGGTYRGHPGNTTPVSEWNVDVDPEAADAVCLAWEAAREADPAVAPAWWCGLNLTERAVWTPERSERLLAQAASADGRLVSLARHLVDALRFYFEFHDSVGEGYLAQVHDPLVAWLALHSEAAVTEPVHLRVECAGEHTRGMTVEDRRGHRGRAANAHLVVDLSVPGGPDAVLDEVMAALADPG